MHAARPAHESEPSPGRWRWVQLGFLAVAAFFLWTEHRAHLLGALPYLLILACPLMHLFMHGGHRHHGGRASTREHIEHEPGSGHE